MKAKVIRILIVSLMTTVGCSALADGPSISQITLQLLQLSISHPSPAGPCGPITERLALWGWTGGKKEIFSGPGDPALIQLMRITYEVMNRQPQARLTAEEAEAYEGLRQTAISIMQRKWGIDPADEVSGHEMGYTLIRDVASAHLVLAGSNKPEHIREATQLVGLLDKGAIWREHAPNVVFPENGPELKLALTATLGERFAREGIPALVQATYQEDLVYVPPIRQRAGQLNPYWSTLVAKTPDGRMYAIERSPYDELKQQMAADILAHQINDPKSVARTKAIEMALQASATIRNFKGSEDDKPDSSPGFSPTSWRVDDNGDWIIELPPMAETRSPWPTGLPRYHRAIPPSLFRALVNYYETEKASRSPANPALLERIRAELNSWGYNDGQAREFVPRPPG